MPYEILHRSMSFHLKPWNFAALAHFAWYYTSAILMIYQISIYRRLTQTGSYIHGYATFYEWQKWLMTKKKHILDRLYNVNFNVMHLNSRHDKPGHSKHRIMRSHLAFGWVQCRFSSVVLGHFTCRDLVQDIVLLGQQTQTALNFI